MREENHREIRSFLRSVAAASGAILRAMKTITSTIRGLVSSLFLALGFSALAQKLDPVTTPENERLMAVALGSEICEIPCAMPIRHA